MAKKTPQNLIAQNRSARFNYHILEEFEAGIVLKGSEIKSIRLGNVNITDSFITIRKGEAFLINSHISKFDKSNIFNHDEKRDRKLLLNKREIRKIEKEIKEKGLTVICINLYFKEGLCKASIAICRGKKLYDKRKDLKDKALKKEMKEVY